MISVKKQLKAVAGTMLLLSSFVGVQAAYAVGTAASTTVNSRATVSYSVGGNAQTPIESSPAGNSTPGAGNGASTAFVVDNRIDLTVTEVSGNATAVTPGQNGARYARATFDGDTHSGFSDLMGADLRRDLKRRFDVGLHFSALNSWRSDVHDYAVGADLGITFARNVWVAVGYNLTGFRDGDFSQNRYTDQGPFIKLRIKADQDTFKDLGL